MGASILWMLLVLWSIVHADYDPLRSVTDEAGTLWQEFYDEETGKFYYFNTITGRSQWLITFAQHPEAPAVWRTRSQYADVLKSRVCEGDEECVGSAANAAEIGDAKLWKDADESVLNTLFPVNKRRRRRFGYEGHRPSLLRPLADDSLRYFLDPAGLTRFANVELAIDALEGIRARRTFSAQLKPPVAVAHMFMQLGGVEAVRSQVEAALMTNGTEPELWEMLGHVWRQYGDVHRAIDCYRQAIYFDPVYRSSLFLSLAGLLDQMNYVDDALTILDLYLDSQDPSTTEADVNFPVAYIMSAQLYVRRKKYVRIGLLLDVALDTQPEFAEPLQGIRKELHYKKFSFGGPPMLFGSSGSSSTFKDPWLLLRPFYEAISLMGSPGWAFSQWLLKMGEKHPEISYFLRKLFNASPCIFGGYISRRTPLLGSALRETRYIIMPTWLELALWLLLTILFSLFTEYTVADVVSLLFLGHVWAISIKKTSAAPRHTESESDSSAKEEASIDVRSKVSRR